MLTHEGNNTEEGEEGQVQCMDESNRKGRRRRRREGGGNDKLPLLVLLFSDFFYSCPRSSPLESSDTDKTKIPIAPDTPSKKKDPISTTSQPVKKLFDKLVKHRMNLSPISPWMLINPSVPVYKKRQQPSPPIASPRAPCRRANGISGAVPYAATATVRTEDGAATVTASTAGAAGARGLPTSSLGAVTGATVASARPGIGVLAATNSVPAANLSSKETAMDFGKRVGKGVRRA